MIHWKNKPIDRLSREELQQALLEAVRSNISPGAAPVGSIHDGFVFGLATGAVLSLAGLLMASVWF